MFKKYNRLVFFDVETTGLSAETDTITEFAASIFEKGDNGKFLPVEEIDVFIKQTKKIPYNIVELTGITDEMCKEHGITPLKFYKDILKKIFEDDKTLIIAHNAKFDKKFVLAYMLKQDSESYIKCDTLDTLEVSKSVTGKSKGNKLCNMIDFYHIEGVENTHRAIDDVKALVEVTRRLWMDSPEIEKFIQEVYR